MITEQAATNQTPPTNSSRLTVPPYHIEAEPSNDVLQFILGNEPPFSIHADLKTQSGEDHFLVECAKRHPVFAQPYAMDSLVATMRELQQGKLTAGSTTNRLQDVLHEVANEPQGQLKIIISDRQLPDISADALVALHQYNTPTPQIFACGNGLARIKNAADGSPIIDPLGIDSATHVLARSADWFRVNVNKKGELSEVATAPPKGVVADILAAPSYDLPPIKGIITAPTFSADGNLITDAGYHASSALFHHRTIEIPPIPLDSTQADINNARDCLIEPFAEFPIIDGADLTNVVAMQITLVARELIDGVTPLFAFDAKCPGTGKTLLASTALYPTLGQNVAKSTTPKDAEEWRKRITSVLLQGRPAIFFDNAAFKIESEHLAAVLTTTEWTDRQLSVNKMLTLPNRAVWIVTGNHLEFSDEINRRTVIIRLNAGEDDPTARNDFAIPNLMAWNQKYRARQLHALLLLVQAWLKAGRPQGTEHLASYESFTGVVGGILKVAGFDGFLANRKPVEMVRWLKAETIDAPNAVTPKRNLILAYNCWRQHQGKTDVADYTFIKELLRHRPNLGEKQPRFGQDRPECFVGLALKSSMAEVQQ